MHYENNRDKSLRYLSQCKVAVSDVDGVDHYRAMAVDDPSCTNICEGKQNVIMKIKYVWN